MKIILVFLQLSQSFHVQTFLRNKYLMEHGAEIPFYLKVSGSIDMTSRANEI